MSLKNLMQKNKKAELSNLIKNLLWIVFLIIILAAAAVAIKYLSGIT